MRIEHFKDLIATTSAPAAARSLETAAPGASLGAPAAGGQDDRFITYDELAEHGIRFTRVHLRRLIGKGLFPAPLQLSANRIAWRAADLARWKAARPIAPMPKDAEPKAVA